MSFNPYLARALRSSDPVLRRPAKVINAVGTLTDRVLGISSTKLRNQAKAMSSAAQTAKAIHPGLASHHQRFADKLQRKAEASTAADKSARIKTVAGIGAAALAHKAYKNATDPYSSFNSQYSY